MNARDGLETRVTHPTDGDAPGILLTGATGFIGTEVLARLVERTDKRIYALVRGSDDAAADARLSVILNRAMGSDAALSDRVVAVRGDVEQPGLGLSAARQSWLADRVGDVVHVAASVSFTLPLERARAINVEGTRHVLEFAERCNRSGAFGRFSHVSTAYVAGDHSGDFGEDDLELGQGFHNTYEQTKFEAERLVRSYADRLPVQVFRPSIIVGDSVTGWTSSFNVMYTPLKAFHRHRVYAVPARESAPVDVVPVDYVAEAMVELVERPEETDEVRTYHLVAGRDATTVGTLVELAARYFGKRKPPLVPKFIYMPFIRPLVMLTSPRARRKALRRTEVFFPYFSLRRRYDDARARPRLERAGIAVPRVEDYFDRLAGFAVQAEWGRVEIPRRPRAAEPAMRV
ncbi:MAG TPA: SDR family oxidoreductase [Thermoleophilaceae bacterium]|nr:SDR family oxidoreductase [Thermoleophilaceae bacterium]